jgi:hypothetical protein
MLNLANRDIYLKLMIDGAPCLPFSANTLAVNGVATALREREFPPRQEARHRKGDSNYM